MASQTATYSNLNKLLFTFSEVNEHNQKYRSKIKKAPVGAFFIYKGIANI
jgi:hypothetical protein